MAYDAAASALVLATGWSYTSLAVGALAIQAAAGFVAGRREGFLAAILAGAATALAEGTLGFGAAWLVGPGRAHLPATLDYAGALGRAVLAGGALGGAGGALTLGWSAERTEEPRPVLRAIARSLRLDGLLVRTFLARGLALWAALRVVLALLQGTGAKLTADAAGARLDQAFQPPSVLVVELLILLAAVDLFRRRELVFFANLGLGPLRALVLVTLPGALLEAAFLLVPR